MENGIVHDARFEVPLPAVRLMMSVGLGVLGMLLMHENGYYTFNPISMDCIRSSAFHIWMLDVIACAILLGHLERTHTPISYLFLFACLVKIHLALRSGGIMDLDGLRHDGSIIFVSALLMHLIRTGRLFHPLQWIEGCLKIPAIALTAPLLLFASQPTGGEKASKSFSIATFVFSIFPQIMAAGLISPYFLLAWFGIDLSMTSWCISFVLWTWISCAVLFILNQWPEEPHIPKLKCFFRTKNKPCIELARVLAPFVFGFCFVITLILGGFNEELVSIFLIPFATLVLFSVLVPDFEFPFIPKLGHLPDNQGMGRLQMMIFLLFPLALIYPWIWMLYRSIGTVIGNFKPDGRGFLLVTVYTALLLPYLEVARWAAKYRSRPVYYLMSIPIRLWLVLMSLLVMSGSIGAALKGECIYLMLTAFQFYALLLIIGSILPWLLLIPFGCRLRTHLHRQGYEWVTLNDAIQMSWRLKGRAYLAPPAVEYEMLPGSRPDTTSLIDFIQEMLNHKREMRKAQS